MHQSSTLIEAGMMQGAKGAVGEAKKALRRSMLRTLRVLDKEEIKQRSLQVALQLFEHRAWREAKQVGCYLSMPTGELQTDEIIQKALVQGKKLYIPYIPTPSSAPKPLSSDTDTHSPNAPIPPPVLFSTTTRLTAETTSTRPKGEEEPELMRMLRLYSESDLKGCKRDKWGIPDPTLYRRDGASPIDVEELSEGGVTSDSVRAGQAREDVMDLLVPPLDLIIIPGVAFDKNGNRLGRGKGYYDRFLSAYTATHPRPVLLAVALMPQLLPADDEIPTEPTDFRLDGVLTPQGVA